MMRFSQFYLVQSLFLIFSITLFGQSMRVSYELTYRINPDVKAEIIKQSYILDISSQKSVFRTEMRKKSDSMVAKTGLGLGYNSNIHYELYFTKEINESNFKKHFVFPLSRDHFIITISDPLQWNILPETMDIENLKCQKAEVEYGGRHWIAWFSKDIAVSEGPYYFHGLPGLIVQIHDDRNDFIFKLTQIKKITDNPLYEMKGGNEITWKQYKKLQWDYFNDPFASIKTKGMNVVTDDGNGGYKPADTREDMKRIQKMLIKNNNPLELNQKVEYQ